MKNFEKIFEEIKKKSEKDLEITKENLQESLFQNSSKKQFYINLLHSMKIKLMNKNNEMEEFYRIEYTGYKEDSYMDFSEKEIDKRIKNTKEYLEINKELKEIERIISFLSDIIENLKEKSYNMKNLLDYYRLQDQIGIQ